MKIDNFEILTNKINHIETYKYILMKLESVKLNYLTNALYLIMKLNIKMFFHFIQFIQSLSTCFVLRVKLGIFYRFLPNHFQYYLFIF